MQQIVDRLGCKVSDIFRTHELSSINRIVLVVASVAALVVLSVSCACHGTVLFTSMQLAVPVAHGLIHPLVGNHACSHVYRRLLMALLPKRSKFVNWRFSDFLF
jgi:hypothetical protein